MAELIRLILQALDWTAVAHPFYNLVYYFYFAVIVVTKVKKKHKFRRLRGVLIVHYAFYGSLKPRKNFDTMAVSHVPAVAHCLLRL